MLFIIVFSRLESLESSLDRLEHLYTSKPASRTLREQESTEEEKQLEREKGINRQLAAFVNDHLQHLLNKHKSEIQAATIEQVSREQTKYQSFIENLVSEQIKQQTRQGDVQEAVEEIAERKWRDQERKQGKMKPF